MTDTGKEQSALDKPNNLTDVLRGWTMVPVDMTARMLVRFGVGPNAITVGGFLLTLGGAYLAAQGEYLRAAIVAAVGIALDGMDGAVARAGKTASRFGAMLDSALDRYGEGALLTALGYHLAQEGNWTGLILAFVALIGSMMVSYIRARSEGLGIANKVGLFTRLERTAVLTLTLLTGYIMPGLWILAIMTQVTVIQRMYVVYKVTRDAEDQP